MYRQEEAGFGQHWLQSRGHRHGSCMPAAMLNHCVCVCLHLVTSYYMTSAVDNATDV